jgi:hypothetical protein
MLPHVTYVPADPPAIDDADTPSAAVGSMPPVDLARVGGPLALVFVVGAAFVVAQRSGWIGPGPNPLSAALALGTFASVARVLLPAALLVRAPDAPRTHRLLFAGLAVGAAAEVLRSAVHVWVLPGGTDDPVWVTLDIAGDGLIALGGLLVGLGLIRLRPRAPGRTWLLVAIAVAYVAFAYAPDRAVALATSSDYSLGYGVPLYVAWLLASAFVAWVAVGAWLDRESPRAFWGLLALALPLTLLAGAVDSVVAVATIVRGPSDLWSSGSTLVLALDALVAASALVAFGRLTPVEAASQAESPPA